MIRPHEWVSTGTLVAGVPAARPYFHLLAKVNTMKIIHNERHTLHYAHTRSSRERGVFTLTAWEGAERAPVPQAIDDKDTPARIESILRALDAAAMTDIAPPADHGLEPIRAVHAGHYIDFLRTIYDEGAAAFGERAPLYPTTFPNRARPPQIPTFALGKLGYYALDIDTPLVEGTYEAAYWCAQTALTACDGVLGGESLIYALCRPSGHHASADQYGGFCFFNNAGIAARYLQTHGTFADDGRRVAILDVDYHHGNGTQDIFYADPSVLFCSLHCDPREDYPYFWGFPEETGTGAGVGCNRNWALPKGTDTAGYMRALDEALDVIRAYRPGYLVVSAGFDTGIGDFYGGFTLQSDDMREKGARIGALCRELGVPAVICQEGGYNVPMLGTYVVAFLRGMEG
jgi:acetoin utilization deacetylase AcuC-like enzyme